MRITWLVCLMLCLACSGKGDGQSEQTNDGKSAKSSTESQAQNAPGDEGCTFDPKPCQNTLAAQNRAGKTQGAERLNSARPPVNKGLALVSTGKNPGRGAENAVDPVMIVKWSDFRCGHCKMLTDTLKGALEKEPNAFRYHFRNFPLDQTCNPTWSPDVAPGTSCLTAYATVCADAQQKFWAMHDRLFENQMTLQNMEEGKAGATLNAFAKEIGLDMASFESCLQATTTKNRVQEDITEAQRLGLRATPLWFMEGVRQSNDVTPNMVLRLAQVAGQRKAGQ